ncbi:High mobility group protein 20A [Cladobotryum mycophilum]|uniref:High mobility group protein 20A n=1 Tax=Cladobotryum mycophilum TaxID=491253 RepID=A0ABR0SE42_9HYPO
MVQTGFMSQELEAIFRDLGIAQYLDAFVEQGFDSWQTILDIQESDLDALGVKLGHRRKLQRRIANARGIAPSASLASPVKPTAEESKPDGNRKELARRENVVDPPVVTKRKYRRHPKADENAPERPPSAYVLFSNKLREGLKGQTLTFTEIAKLVGENWQSLSPTEREKYENQANAAKERYHREMVAYKKSAEYRKYMRYLQEFKEKQGKPVPGQEGAKRPKLEQTQLAPGSSRTGSSTAGSSAAAGGPTSIASGSSSERVRESESREPPSRRHDSVTSVASVTESRPSSTAPKSTASVPSPRTAHFDLGTPKRGQQRHTRRASSLRGRGRRVDATHQALPPLADVLVDTQRTLVGPPSADGHAFITGFTPANQRHPLPQGSPALGHGPMSFLHHDSSSSGGGAPTGTSSFGRRSSDGPLAIHALLSDQGSTTHHGYERSPSSVTSAVSPIEQGKPLFGQFQGPRGYGFQNPSSAFQHMKVEDTGDGDVLMTTVDQPSDGKDGNGKRGFDGMNALLRAGEIVGRNNRG